MPDNSAILDKLEEHGGLLASLKSQVTEQGNAISGIAGKVEHIGRLEERIAAAADQSTERSGRTNRDIDSLWSAQRADAARISVLETKSAESTGAGREKWNANDSRWGQVETTITRLAWPLALVIVAYLLREGVF